MRHFALTTAASLVLASGVIGGAQATQVALISGITVTDFGRVNPLVAGLTQPTPYQTSPLSGAYVAVMTGQQGGGNPYAPNPGWDPFGPADTTHQWINVGDNNTGAFYALSGHSLTIVWGSPNDNSAGNDNVVSFLDSSSNVIGSVEAADLYSKFSGITNTTEPGYLINFAVPTAFSAVEFSTGPSAFEFAVANVPEPSTWAMMLLGFSGLGYAAFRRNGRKTAIA
jgi:hypothetical protein